MPSNNWKCRLHRNDKSQKQIMEIFNSFPRQMLRGYRKLLLRRRKCSNPLRALNGSLFTQSYLFALDMRGLQLLGECLWGNVQGMCGGLKLGDCGLAALSSTHIVHAENRKHGFANANEMQNAYTTDCLSSCMAILLVSHLTSTHSPGSQGFEFLARVLENRGHWPPPLVWNAGNN